jgi:hypothetical protein
MVTESIVHGVLLALHNLALVGCAAAPLYNRKLVGFRAQYGPRLHYELDKVVEDTLQSNAPYCMAFLLVLFVTGSGMPLNHYLFHGELRSMHLVAMIAMALKLIAVFGVAIWGMRIFFGLNPKLRERFARFEPGTAPDPAQEQEFFRFRARRKALCDTCFWFAVAVLVFSGFIGFAG